MLSIIFALNVAKMIRLFYLKLNRDEYWGFWEDDDGEWFPEYGGIGTSDDGLIGVELPEILASGWTEIPTFSNLKWLHCSECNRVAIDDYLCSVCRQLAIEINGN